MLKLSVGCLDTPALWLLRCLITCTLKALDISGLTRSTAWGMKALSRTAITTTGDLMTVST